MLERDEAVNAILTAFGTPAPTVKVTIKIVEPRFTAADRATIRIGDDVLAEAVTYYGGSSEPRRNNVERAAELENGWLIPPGGAFSYVDNVGRIDESNGFVTGYGIVATSGGGFTTAPVIGGGVCQVSTTIFQAVFWAGLPITERYQHPYYLRSYGEAPRGLPGLDAMVNVEEEWALDLKFTNPTDHWLALILVADGETLTAKIVGTDPGWEVQVAEPKITKIVRAEERMYYVDSPELPRGQELLVETAEDGFDVTVERTVVKNGAVIDTYAVSSSFAPARNTTLRGTG
jgi:vancomycin resistance protein YoaR